MGFKSGQLVEYNYEIYRVDVFTNSDRACMLLDPITGNVLIGYGGFDSEKIEQLTGPFLYAEKHGYETLYKRLRTGETVAGKTKNGTVLTVPGLNLMDEEILELLRIG